MSHEELESYGDRFNEILQGTDKRIKTRRLINLASDLRTTYNIPSSFNINRFSEVNPEVASLFREVVEKAGNSILERMS